MPVQDPLGLRRCALCGNAFTTERHDEATRLLVERGALNPGQFVCRRCVGRIEREYGGIPGLARTS